jgi:hypothetical protein
MKENMDVNNMKNIKIKKNPMITLDEHRKMGKMLRDARNELVANGIVLDQIFGTTKKLGLMSVRATKIIDEMRSGLGDILFDEYPDLETKDGCKYYY